MKTYLLDLFEKEKYFKEEKSKKIKNSILFFVLSLSSYILDNSLPYLLIPISIFMLYYSLTYNKEKYIEEKINELEHEIRKKLVRYISTINILILSEKGENFVWKLEREFPNDMLINEIIRLYRNSKRIIELNKYFKDENIISLITIIDKVLYEFDEKMIKDYISSLKKILDSYNEKVNIISLEIQEQSKNMSSMLVVGLSMIPLLILGVALYFVYPSKNYSLFLSYLTSSSVLFFILFFSFLLKIRLDSLLKKL